MFFWRFSLIWWWMIMNDNSAKIGLYQIDEPNICYENTKPECVARTFFLLATVLGNTTICCSICHNQSLHCLSNYLVALLVIGFNGFVFLPSDANHQSELHKYRLVFEWKNLSIVDLDSLSIPLHLLCKLRTDVCWPFCNNKISTEISNYNPGRRSVDAYMHLVSWRRYSFIWTL